MADADKALETMIQTIEQKTGKTMAQLAKIVKSSGLTKHGEIRAMVMATFGLGHGHANTVVHLALKSDGESAAKARGLTPMDVLDEIYGGKKAALRPIHDRILEVMRT